MRSSMLTNRNIYFDFTSFSNRHFSSTKKFAKVMSQIANTFQQLLAY